MSRIKPPHEFRSPRSIETYLLYWKASEYRAFLLFYAIPLLKPFLQPEYFLHLSLLVFSIHTLLSNSIDVQILAKVQTSIRTFYDLIPQLYGKRLCTANMHSLIHLVKFVTLWGPLWTHSTFCFENANGLLKRHIHGTRNILLQAVFMMKLKQYFSLQSSGCHSNNSTKLAANMFVVGKICKTKLTDINAETLGLSVSLVFGRVKLNGILYTSKHSEKKGASRNSSVMCFKNHDSSIAFGEILLFSLSKPPIALIKKFTVVNDNILEGDDTTNDQQIDVCS